MSRSRSKGRSFANLQTRADELAKEIYVTDLFPTPPPETKYSEAFEKCWRQHSVGTKKSAFAAGKKAQWSDGNWAWLERYLERRHKDDAKWLEGKYVPHLSSVINGERWTDSYSRVQAGRQTESPQHAETHDEALAKIRLAYPK